MGLYKHLSQMWNRPEGLKDLWRKRLIQWRQEPSNLRIEHPTRLDRARILGYKAKQGFVIVRERVLRGGHQRPTIRAGRTSKHFHRRLSLRKNYQLIAEERVQRAYKNLVVLNSYPVAKDGSYFWFEVILVDPEHPVIKADPQLKWICKQKNRSRVFHGKTAAGMRTRGMAGKGKGYEKARPSRRAHQRLQ